MCTVFLNALLHSFTHGIPLKSIDLASRHNIQSAFRFVWVRFVSFRSVILLTCSRASPNRPLRISLVSAPTRQAFETKQP